MTSKWQAVRQALSPKPAHSCAWIHVSVACGRLRAGWGLVKVCRLSSHWGDTYGMVCSLPVVYKEVEGFSLQPCYYSDFLLSLKFTFHTGQMSYKGNGSEEIFWDLTSTITLYIKASLQRFQTHQHYLFTPLWGSPRLGRKVVECQPAFELRISLLLKIFLPFLPRLLGFFYFSGLRKHCRKQYKAIFSVHCKYRHCDGNLRSEHLF